MSDCHSWYSVPDKDAWGMVLWKCDACGAKISGHLRGEPFSRLRVTAFVRGERTVAALASRGGLTCGEIIALRIMDA